MQAQNHERKILVLHGDRQTGDLLVGRMASLRKKLLKPRNHHNDDDSSGNPNNDTEITTCKMHEDPSKCKIQMVAPNGPFQWNLELASHVKDSGDKLTEEEKRENDLMRTWWNRDGDKYGGLEDSLEMLHMLWKSDQNFEGIFGFSRGARLAHMAAYLHEASNGQIFPKLKYVIMASGYGHVPMPTNFPPKGTIWDEYKLCENPCPISVPSMHIMGEKDRLIPLEASRALLSSYVNPLVHEHDGGHHVPMRAANVRTILSFIDTSVSRSGKVDEKMEEEEVFAPAPAPDEEHALTQEEECQSMALIFPDEFKMISETNEVGVDEYGEEKIEYVHPITYKIQLKPPLEELENDKESAILWPVKDIALKVEYSADYPDSMPHLSLCHNMNLLEFRLCQERACLSRVDGIAKDQIGMPFMMSCVYEAREFFTSGGLSSSLISNQQNTDSSSNNIDETNLKGDNEVGSEGQGSSPSILKPISDDVMKQCIEEGLEIACLVLKKGSLDVNNLEQAACGKGGRWKYTIGLVGKPSAGKSTFFNAASAFARQKGGDEVGEDGIAFGGAAMAPHPFTTIDPNVGVCLVPAPPGSCPEENKCDASGNPLSDTVACTHGRDSFGRRLIPMMLKDVAGLVPGAYQGRGRGNKFLDDLTDADVLIHVLDSSGTADAEGNTVVTDINGKDDSVGSNPMNDLDWVFNELVQWVFFNVLSKWDSIVRKGQDKLAGMLSGYKQNQAFVYNVLFSVEKYLHDKKDWDHALRKLKTWDQGDLYRLVAAFLGARFPVTLALNKYDIPSAKTFCSEIIQSLPFHGAHHGTPMSAHEEMLFVKRCMMIARGHEIKKHDPIDSLTPPHGVWNALQSAITMREPILVFPVSDMETYQPISPMTEFAINCPSLPNAGMVECLKASGGSPPTLWNDEKMGYLSFEEDSRSKESQVLRDVILMKPGSTVEDVFSVLKGVGALGGEFVRAEAVSCIGDKPKLVKKDDMITKHNRILKIMTTKRREWQKKKSQS